MARILLVDDERVARTLYGDFLTGAGHEVRAVGSGTEAKEALTGEPFDLLVTDLLLPGLDGMELLAYVKTTHPDVEVLIITALDKVEPAVRAIKAGANDYLVKPVGPEVLAQAVLRALAQRSLLSENEALRRHASMLEAGQRIALTLDRERLLESAGTAFLSSCGADAVALFVRDGASGLQPGGAFGCDEADGKALLDAALPVVNEAAEAMGDGGQELYVEAKGYETAFGVAAIDGEQVLGAAVLFYRRDIAEAGAAASPYLARHLALGLKNLGRFTEVEDLVYLDDLTHLFNRRYLELMLDKAFKKAGADEKPFALLFLDLDYFKSINDTHGHLIGSRLLIEVARLVKNCVRDDDVVSRWGGDEYVCLLRGTDSGGAFKVAERIRRAVESHRFLAREGYGLSLTTCIGVASHPEHASDKETLIDFADRAMYRGKKGSRNIIYMAAGNLEATPAARRVNEPPQGD